MLLSCLLGTFNWAAALALAAFLIATAAGVVGVAFAAISGAPSARRAGPAVVALVALTATPARFDGLRAVALPFAGLIMARP